LKTNSKLLLFRVCRGFKGRWQLAIDGSRATVREQFVGLPPPDACAVQDDAAGLLGKDLADAPVNLT